MKRECSERLMALAQTDEHVLARGTVDEMKQLNDHISSGGAWTFFVLTDRRMIFANWGLSRSHHEEILLDDVSAWTEATQQHRYAIRLTHPPMTV